MHKPCLLTYELNSTLLFDYQLVLPKCNISNTQIVELKFRAVGT